MTLSERTRNNILEQVEQIGKALARMATPGYWSYEQHDRAKYYEAPLEATRHCWREIKRGGDMLTALRTLKTKVNGIEGNHVAILIRELEK